MKRAAVAVAALTILTAACGGGSDHAESTTTTERTTGTTEPAISRATELAVRRCVDAHQSLGIRVTLGFSEDYDAMESACDEASVQLDTDAQGVIGPIRPRRLNTLIAERRYEASTVKLAATMGSPDAEDEAAKLDASYYEWSGKVSALLEKR